MKNWLVVSVLALLLVSGFAFAGTAAISSFGLNAIGTKSIASVSIDELTFSNTADINALCISTSDNNAIDKCTLGDSFSAPIALSYTKISGLSSDTPTDGNYSIYVYVRQDDGNFSSALRKYLVVDNTAPVISSSYPANGGDYNSTTINFDINVTDSYSTLGTPTIKVNGSAQTITTTNTITNGKQYIFSMSGLTDGNHTLTVDVNDSLNNALSGATIIFRTDNAAPSIALINSNYISTYTNDEEPNFDMNASDSVSGMTGGKVAFSCSGVAGKWQEFDFASTITTFNITASTYDCNSADANKVIYFKMRDKAGNWSSTKITSVLYDNTAPSPVANLSVSSGDKQATLTWTAPNADNLSGNAGYKIYKDGTMYSTVTSTTATISDLTNGTKYLFKVRTFDNAGNESTDSSTVEATPSGGTANISVTKSNLSADYAKAGDTLTGECSFSKTVTAARLKYKYYSPDKDAQTLKGPTDNVTSLAENVSVSSGYDKIGFWCEATDGSASITSSTKYVLIDSSKPNVAWNDNNASFIGVRRVAVTASDNYMLEKVEFVFNGVYFGATNTGSIYYIDINTKAYENGSYTIKVIGYDKAGNQNSLERAVTVDNLLSDVQKATKAIAEAKVRQQSVNDLIKYFEEQGLIFSSELVIKKESADATLIEAEKILKTNPALALNKATEVKALYELIKKSAAVNTVQSKQYEYNQSTVADKLRSAGLDEALVLLATSNIENSNVERKLSIIRIGTEDKYQVSIEISFTNDINSGIVKIVEVIPKELIASASNIYSNFEFKIIQDDPIIEFLVPASNGASAKVSYGIGEVTKEEADALIASDVIAKFAAPPILLPSDTDTERAFGPSAADMFIGGIMILVLIIIVLVVVGGVFLVKFRHPSNKFGEKKSLIERVKPVKAPMKKKWQHK